MKDTTITSDAKKSNEKPQEMTFASGGDVRENRVDFHQKSDGGIEELELENEVSVFEDDSEDSAEGIVQMIPNKPSGYKMMQ